MSDKERELELEALKEQRKQDIKTRLLKSGWTEREVEPSPDNTTEWNKLVWQPKPVTDRIWNNLYPKLVPLLESNQVYNAHVDKYNRKHDRIVRIDELVTKIKQALPPLVHVTSKRAVNESDANGPSTSSTSNQTVSGLNNIDLKVEMPFRPIAEILTWPMIEDIIKNDTSLEESETSFNAIREEFNLAVVEWRDRVEQELINIWNSGRAEEETRLDPSKPQGEEKTAVASVSQPPAGDISPNSLELVLPELDVTFTKPDGTTTPDLSELSPNVQLLLRADTLFESYLEYSYPDILRPPTPAEALAGDPDEGRYVARWYADSVERDDKGSAMAKVLLKRMGRSGAATAKMSALGKNFKCGRCSLIETWEFLVRHYAREQTRWERAQKRMKETSKSDIVYHPVHNLGPDNTKPFAYFLTSEVPAPPENPVTKPIWMLCKPCKRMKIEASFRRSSQDNTETPMEEHLREVHDIEEAVHGVHFYRWQPYYQSLLV
ncbi:hypothetical protein FRC07_004329 [Ceratobasidium sp. 392]|nr:hypothetical protein FRC07_004329 [Ceratobasidium sp. 392]